MGGPQNTSNYVGLLTQSESSQSHRSTVISLARPDSVGESDLARLVSNDRSSIKMEVGHFQGHPELTHCTGTLMKVISDTGI